MSGIGYDSSIIVYNKVAGSWKNDAEWYGTKLDHVRVELVTGTTQTVNGDTNANTCTFKIYDADLPYPPITREEWNSLTNIGKKSQVLFDKESYILVVFKPDIGIHNMYAPEGQIKESDEQYPEGLVEYLSAKYGGLYHVRTVQHYSLIPHWEIGGR